MKKRTAISLIIGSFISLAIIASTILEACFLADSQDKRFYLIIIMAVIGLIGGYLLHNLLHEAGHAISAKAAGAKVFEFAFCGFTFKKGSAFKFAPNKNFAGYTAFVPLTPEKSLKTLGASLIGGLTGSFLSLAIAIIGYAVAKVNANYLLLTLFGFYTSLNVYLIVVNFFTHKKGTDGSLMSTNGKELNDDFYVGLANLEYQSHMLNGKSAKDIPYLIVSRIKDQPHYTIYDVQKSLSEGDIIRAEAFLNSALVWSQSQDNGLIDLYLEQLFVDLVKANAKNIKTYSEKLIDVLEQPESLSSLRTAIYFRYYNGETEWAESLKKTYYNELQKCPLIGLRATEKEIFEKYLDTVTPDPLN